MIEPVCPSSPVAPPSGPTSRRPPQATERFLVEHVTRYTYSEPVSLDQLVLRLQPRTDATQRLVQFTIDLDPTPARHTYCLDLHGNLRHWFWFDQLHPSLTITTRCIVDCCCANPFDFIIVDPGVERLPAVYAEPVNAAAWHYRQRADLHPSIDELAAELMAEADHQTVPFLWALAQHLSRQVKHIVRVEGEAWPAHRTLACGEGACRDSAVLFMEVCRAAGLAARFVSGYAFEARDPARRELHAWAEVYLPGAGWRGYDPSSGLAVSNRHVAVASSPTPSYAAPTAGTFTGPQVESELTYQIDMTRDPSLVQRLDDASAYYRWP